MMKMKWKEEEEWKEEEWRMCKGGGEGCKNDDGK
jgi:hypothetical protein